MDLGYICYKDNKIYQLYEKNFDGEILEECIGEMKTNEIAKEVAQRITGYEQYKNEHKELMKTADEFRDISKQELDKNEKLQAQNRELVKIALEAKKEAIADYNYKFADRINNALSSDTEDLAKEGE